MLQLTEIQNTRIIHHKSSKISQINQFTDLAEAAIIILYIVNLDCNPQKGQKQKDKETKGWAEPNFTFSNPD